MKNIIFAICIAFILTACNDVYQYPSSAEEVEKAFAYCADIANKMKKYHTVVYNEHNVPYCKIITEMNVWTNRVIMIKVPGEVYKQKSP